MGKWKPQVLMDGGCACSFSLEHIHYSKCKEPTPQLTVLGQSMGENHALHGVNEGRDSILLVCQFILSADGRTKSCAGWTVVLPQGGESVMNGLPMVQCREEAW